MTRVTITLTHLNPEDDVVFLTEWAHEDGFADEPLGVRLTWWNEPDKGATFIPWSSVLRVDWEPCHCADCRSDPEPSLDAAEPVF